MNLNYHHKLFIFLFLLLGATISKATAQDSAVAAPILGVRYFLSENKVPYIDVSTKRKVGRIFEPVKGIPVNIYLGEASDKNLLGKVITGIKGTGRVAIPIALQSTWDSLDEFKIVAVSDSIAGVESLSGDATIKKAILVIDTTSADGVRTVTAQLKEKKGKEWVAVKEIEMKLGIKRMLGNLSVGDAETYTSDSTGVASADFKRDSIAGDEKGNLFLVARVEDNDTYGNLVVEKLVPWGKPTLAEANFWRRTLWSTGNRVPVWLLFIAVSIIVGVWGVIIYLIRQVIKMKKMGKEFVEPKLSV